MKASDALREALMMCDPEFKRASISAPEDAAVLDLCMRVGFGAVMDSAARQWRKRDPKGAFTVGPCVLVAQRALATTDKGATNEQ